MPIVDLIASLCAKSAHDEFTSRLLLGNKSNYFITKIKIKSSFIPSRASTEV